MATIAPVLPSVPSQREESFATRLVSVLADAGLVPGDWDDPSLDPAWRAQIAPLRKYLPALAAEIAAREAAS